MKQLKCLIILVYLIGVPKIGECGEFASWWQKTPNNNEICNEKWTNKYLIGIKCKDYKINKSYEYGHIISDLAKWYFYKNQIIGEYKSEENIAYFIFDELTCKKQTFDLKSEFQNKLKELNLNPMIWTRWYKSNWGMIFTNGGFGEAFMFIYFKLPILIITTIIFLIGLIKTKFNLKHKFNKFTFTIMGVIVGRILLDIFPNSF